MSFQFVFNQYYIDLLKRLKSECKKIKDNSEDEDVIILSKKVSKSIKDNYMTIDKSSDVYIKYINDLNADFWASYLQAESSEMTELFTKEEISNIELFINISIGDIFKILDDNYLSKFFILNKF